MFIPPSCIDTLYDYIPLLKEEGLCTIPPKMLGTEVAIIGSGAAGLLAAHEILKMGLTPVIYEANNRMGGRIYSKCFESLQEEHKPFVELGAMRIPYSSRIFFHYADQLGLSSDLIFPNPGQTETAIYFKNKIYPWPAYKPMPEPFRKIDLLWHQFVNPLVLSIHREWKKGDIQRVKELWQAHINQYKHMSLYQALVARSEINTPEKISIFATLGVGHGSMGSLFQVSFLEILRLLVNKFMGVDVFVAEGVSEFINRLYRHQVKTPSGLQSLADINCVKLNLPVVLLDYNKKTRNPLLITKNQNGIFDAKEYGAIIFTGSLRAAHLINVTNKTKSGVYLFSASVREAIKTSPMIASSKTYICTETKFWKALNIPCCLISDDITRASYCVDYPWTKHGVICLSYTWAMDSMKLHAVAPRDRVTIFKRSLRAVFPEIDKYIVPLNGEVISIDWINEKYQNGAFKVFTPGNDLSQRELYLQFKSCLTKEDKGVYIAGDGVSWAGGWVEGALTTSLNAVFAVVKRLGGKIPENSPLDQDSNLYEY